MSSRLWSGRVERDRARALQSRERKEGTCTEKSGLRIHYCILLRGEPGKVYYRFVGEGGTYIPVCDRMLFKGCFLVKGFGGKVEQLH